MGAVAVIGLGTMGQGIAQVALDYGFDLTLYDIDSVRTRAAADRVLLKWNDRIPLVETVHAQKQIAPILQTHDSIEGAVEGVDVVIECVPERASLKAQVLKAIVGAAPSESIIATNTSTMSIGALAHAGGCEGRLVGMHFFNPAEKMRLVEVIRAPGVPGSWITQAEQFVRSLGKSPIVIADSPGFVTSRLGLVLGNEAMRLVESGVASVSAIDAAMRLGYNHPMGPLELADLVGLDARLNNLRSIHEALQDVRFEPPQILIDLVEANHLGRKTGQGFYVYDANGHKSANAECGEQSNDDTALLDELGRRET